MDNALILCGFTARTGLAIKKNQDQISIGLADLPTGGKAFLGGILRKTREKEEKSPE
jgi:CRISPR/Cas system CSM-associated protein Csm3 (group 7 of RAMP superfamily)